MNFQVKNLLKFGNISKRMEKKMPTINDETSQINETATQLLFSEEPIYKNWDYRCLAPHSDRDPEKWRSYDMPAFRAAHNKETLESVATFPYDKNFNNWRDLSVLISFVNDPRKAWKEAYGLPYASPLPSDRTINESNDNSTVPLWRQHKNYYISRKYTTTQKKIFVDKLDSSKCHLKCLQLVRWTF